MRSCRSHRTALVLRPSPRPGYTLGEIVAVAVLVVALIGLLAPTLTNFRRAGRPRQAAVILMGRLSACRVHALSYGRAYDFYLEPAGRHYLILPAADSTGGTVATNGGAADSSRRPIVYWGELPDGIRFDFQSSSRSTAPIAGERLATVQRLPDDWRNVGWAAPIRFFADGTAQPADLTLVDAEGRRARLQVQSDNGSVRLVSDVASGRRAIAAR